MKIQKYEPKYIEETTDAFVELSRFYLGENASDRVRVRANIIENITHERSGVELLIGIEQSKIVGVSTVSLLYPAPKETGQLYIKELFVLPEFQGKGLGKQFMSYIANFAIELNCTRLDWSTEKDNMGAIAFYNGLGAKQLQSRVYYRVEGEGLTKLAKTHNNLSQKDAVSGASALGVK